ncbi:hypothetical protein SLS53_002121 [Cytospora paraplurivora]|uniref:Asl1-like glycosyl hydrolase catalytic domain-containing protein n=1 Tax=Cytospora paraplurivora TaxID=2898453 RepID=A0AAN9UQ22_9PEZI
MFSKAFLAVLATGALTSNGAHALSHRHAQRHHHEDKRAIVYEATETVTDITWVTVTVDPNQESSTVAPVVETAVPTTSLSVISSAPAAATLSTSSVPTTTTSITLTSVVASTSAASSVASVADVVASSSVSSSTPATTSVAPTTLVTSTSAATSAASVSSAAASSSASSSSFVKPAVAVVESTSSNKRGAAYNTASLISPLIGSGSKIGWAYNWGQVEDGLSDVDSSLEFVPMLWSTRSDFISTWTENAEAAISAGAKNFLSFNEPDNVDQANMDASTAASAFIQYMTPYADSVSLGSPAITNSGTDGEGVSWLKEWVSACNDECQYSFCAAHWYSPAESSVFLEFVSDVYEACGNKPVWITEFAPTGADDATISSFLEEIQDALDNNSTYSFVERYAYFYVADGYLVDGTSASSYGNTFAYGS